jgi:hypothetical protein
MTMTVAFHSLYSSNNCVVGRFGLLSDVFQSDCTIARVTGHHEHWALPLQAFRVGLVWDRHDEARLSELGSSQGHRRSMTSLFGRSTNLKCLAWSGTQK